MIRSFFTINHHHYYYYYYHYYFYYYSGPGVVPFTMGGEGCLSYAFTPLGVWCRFLPYSSGG